MHIKCSAQGLAHGKCSINVRNYNCIINNKDENDNIESIASQWLTFKAFTLQRSFSVKKIRGKGKPVAALTNN